MDNLTHLLVGVLVAEASICLRERAHPAPDTAQGFRKATYFASLLSNNLPDFDFLYAWGNRPISYLLHHRGHTHTLPIALLLALFGFLLVRALAKFRHWQLDAQDPRRLLMICGFGTLIHILLDSANNYGVHPFWPLDNTWYYGDAFFILEPFFWAALIAPLLFSIQRMSARIVFGLVLLAGIGLCLFSGLVPLGMALALTSSSAVLGVVGWRLTTTGRVWLSASAFVAAALIFIVSSNVIRARVSAQSKREFPEAQTHDLVLTPMPANPVCFSVLLVQTEGDRYIVRTGTASLMPGWYASSECTFGTERSKTAQGKQLTFTQPDLRWLSEVEMPLNELRKLANEHCRAAAFLRFARVPYRALTPTYGSVMLDMRYDRSEDLEFAEFSLADRQNCPHWVPPWKKPRSRILGE